MKIDNNKMYLNYEDVEGLVSAIGREILLSDWQPDYIVGIGRGGLLPATLLSHFINVPMHSLDVSLRDSKSEPTSNCWMAEDAFGYVDTQYRKNIDDASSKEKRKNILVIDDINDSGDTLAWIQNDWVSGCLPDDDAWNDILGNNVRVAVLVNNEASKWKHVDYVGTEINKEEDDLWVVFPIEDWWKAKP